MKINGNIVDVVNGEIFTGELEIAGGRIQSITPKQEVTNQYIIPGFIDAHVHIESSMLIPSEFGRLAVAHGSVGSVSDPHEIGNVLGKEGVRFMIENGLTIPFKFYFGAPSCVPATSFETAGATLDLKDIEEIFQYPNVTYLAEMMKYPGVLAKDPLVMEKIKLALSLDKKVDGHAPGLRGEEVWQYASAGITTDHECFTKEEALDKLNAGMHILIREGSAAKNFEALYTLIDEYPENVMFCSDDKHPNELVKGHINLLAKRAIAKGCNTMNVLRACSLNPIKHYNMNIGLVQKGDPADFCVVNNLRDFKVLETYIDGRLVFDGKTSLIESVQVEDINKFNCEPISESQIAIKDVGKKVKVIEVEDGQLITKSKVAKLLPENDCLQSDVPRDILKMVVVNRYLDAPPAVTFASNFGLKKGAIASCVAHDSHNIIAVGCDDVDICNAINLIIEAKGGISISSGDFQEVLPLPIAGIMSKDDGYQVATQYEEMDQKAKSLGSQLSAPFMTLSFCALLVIPELKLSDKGLFDVNSFSFTNTYSKY